MNQALPTLEGFIKWFMSCQIWQLSPVADEFYDFGKFTSIILHREEPFQVELFQILPGTTIGEPHVHPNVDAYEMGLCGEINFKCEGIDFSEPQKTVPLHSRDFIEVKSTYVHSAHPKTPGAFLSFQYWKNGVRPTSVGLDWKDESDSPRDYLRDIKKRDQC